MSLSDKFPYEAMEDSEQWIKIEDVKDFIKKLYKMNLKSTYCDKDWEKGYKFAFKKFKKRLRYLAGDKLI